MSFELRKVDVFDFLDALGIRNIEQSGDEYKFSCPFDGHSHGDMKASAYMNSESTAWLCHGCKRRGNAVHFLARLENISPLLALRYIRERYESDFREPGDSLLAEFDEMFFSHLEHEDMEGVRADDQVPNNIYEVDWTSREALSNVPEGCSEYIFGRGFRPDTLVEWGVGYCEVVDRITLPVIDQHGVLRGFKGRAWRPDHQPKYLVLGDAPGRVVKFGFNTYEKSKYVYGIHRAKFKHGLVVEGELNAIALDQKVPTLGSPVALNGSDISEAQVRQLTRNFDHVTVIFDTDPAGIAGALKVARELVDYIPVYVAPDHDGDPADLTAEECVSLIESATPVIETLVPDV